MQKEHYHGHYQRLRRRFLQHGLGGFQDYEALELLLTFVSRRQDMKPLAKDLVRRFGSFKNVLDVSPEELGDVKGVGPAAVTLIQFVRQAAARYLQQTSQARFSLDSPEALIKYCILSMGAEPNEKFCVICLDSSFAIVDERDVAEDTVNQATVYPRKVMEIAWGAKATTLVFVHNHPDGNVTPSEFDKTLTRGLALASKTVNVSVYDHLIVSRDTYFSFREKEDCLMIAGTTRNTQHTPIYPGAEWERISPAEAGLDPERLESAQRWLDNHVGDGRYRVVMVRGGRVVAEWNHGVGREEQLWLASAAKSIFSCILGIAIEEGKIPSADAKIIDYYPEAMDVPEGEGPKEGRYVFEKDYDITFRQLISNTSGYMKPGEEPGKVFHYQTYGMNILTHAIAKIYGLYDIRDPEGSPGFKQLVDEKLRIPIGATWSYYLANFDLHPKARIHIFGYYDGVQSTALDMARLGWLWRNWGRWEDRQLIPEAWLREATQTAPDIRAHCPREQWEYGYAFWTNDYGQLWPSLPRDSYAASGAGSQHIWVCPSLDLVVVQSPGLWQDQVENDTGLLRLVVDAC